MRRAALALALSAGLLVACSGPALAAPPTPPVSTCGWWRDYSSSKGGALSAYPGKTPTHDTQATVQGDGAWRVCINVGNQQIWLKSAPTYFLADVGGLVKWTQSDHGQAGLWTFHQQPGPQGGWEVTNRQFSDLDLCAQGGGGSRVDFALVGHCASHRREVWAWSSQPQRRVILPRAP